MRKTSDNIRRYVCDGRFEGGMSKVELGYRRIIIVVLVGYSGEGYVFIYGRKRKG